MKCICTFVYVLAIASFIGSALGDEVSGDLGNPASAGGGHVCDVQLEEGESPNYIPDTLMHRMLNCFTEELKFLKNAINVSRTTEEYQKAFKTSCVQLPRISACTADVAANVHKCLNETHTSSFKVLRNVIDTAMSVGCEDDGVKLADIAKEVRIHRENSEDRPDDEICFLSSDGNMKTLDANDPSKASVALFRMLKAVNMCIADRGQGQIVLNNLMVSYLGDITARLKCIHPVSNIEVLCESFVTN